MYTPRLFLKTHFLVPVGLVALLIFTSCGVSFAQTANSFPGASTSSNLSTNAMTVETRSMVINGAKRTYQIQKPTGTDVRYPVVIVMHGGGGSIEDALVLSGFPALAQREKFILVAPQGLKGGWDAVSKTGSAGDVKFIGKIIDTVVAKDYADKTRIFATGMSAGGAMSFLLGCEMSDRIAAIAPVGILMHKDLAKYCKPSRPLPIMVVHGTADTHVPAGGGTLKYATYHEVLSQKNTLTFWATRNGCFSGVSGANLENTSKTDRSTVTKYTYKKCKNGVETLFYEVRGGGHTWPGGNMPFLIGLLLGVTNKDMNATETIWKFFNNVGHK